jgi:hypothetical protein
VLTDPAMVVHVTHGNTAGLEIKNSLAGGIVLTNLGNMAE